MTDKFVIKVNIPCEYLQIRSEIQNISKLMQRNICFNNLVNLNLQIQNMANVLSEVYKHSAITETYKKFAVLASQMNAFKRIAITLSDYKKLAINQKTLIEKMAKLNSQLYDFEFDKNTGIVYNNAQKVEIEYLDNLVISKLKDYGIISLKEDIEELNENVNKTYELQNLNNEKIEELLEDAKKLDKPDRSVLLFILSCIFTLLLTVFASDIEDIKDNLINDIKNEKNIENEEKLRENFITDVFYLADKDKNYE